MQSGSNGHKHIWLLSGTGEGPLLATAFVEKGWRVTVSVVTPSAVVPYSGMPFTSIRIGSLQGPEGIKGVLKEALELHDGFDWVIDATHPFAVEISANLYKACNEFGQSLLRFERPMEEVSGAYLIKDLQELSKYFLEGRNVLIALGARHLCEAVCSAQDAGAKVFARILPNPESLKQALMCPIPESGLAVLRPLQGEKKGDFERALCRRWSISDVICRESGGLTQQLWQEICHEENINLWLITRPPLGRGVEVFHTFSSVLRRISMSK